MITCNLNMILYSQFIYFFLHWLFLIIIFSLFGPVFFFQGLSQIAWGEWFFDNRLWIFFSAKLISFLLYFLFSTREPLSWGKKREFLNWWKNVGRGYQEYLSPYLWIIWGFQLTAFFTLFYLYPHFFLFPIFQFENQFFESHFWSTFFLNLAEGQGFWDFIKIPMILNCMLVLDLTFLRFLRNQQKDVNYTSYRCFLLWLLFTSASIGLFYLYFKSFSINLFYYYSVLAIGCLQILKKPTNLQWFLIWAFILFLWIQFFVYQENLFLENTSKFQFLFLTVLYICIQNLVNSLYLKKTTIH
jgi:hypothetical protein